jgi:hypothetical protein
MALVLFGFVLFLGKLLQLSNGEYRRDFLIELILMWGFTIAQLLRTQPLSVPWTGRRFRASFLPRVVAVGCLYFAIELSHTPLVQFNESPPSYLAIRVLLYLVAGCVAGLTWLVLQRPQVGRLFAVLCGVATLASLVVRVLVVAFSPNPFIDCFTISTDAAAHLLAGLNPYAQQYVDIYQGAYHYPHPPGFNYWPAVLYVQTLCQFLLGDHRYAFVLSDLATALGLLQLARRLALPPALRGLLPLCWLCFPVGLHVLELSWKDPLLIACAVWSVVLLLDRRWWSAGALLGFFCGCKQYSVLFALLYVLAVWRRGGSRALWECSVAATAVLALLMVPFVMADFAAFYLNTVQLLIDVPLRSDALSIPAAMVREQLGQVPSWLMALSYALLWGLGALWVVRRHGSLFALGSSLVLVYGGTFLMGKQAFCNYYHLLASFALLALLGCWETAESLTPARLSADPSGAPSLRAAAVRRPSTGRGTPGVKYGPAESPGTQSGDVRG